MIDASTLNTGTDFGPSDVGTLTEAWRQAHYAAQAAAEVGKGWAVEEPDDSHSSLAWVSPGSWHGLEGVPAAGPNPCRARLRFEALELSLDDGQGRAVAQFSLLEHTLEEAMSWIASTCELVLGPRPQPSRPAPDLPPHPIGDGAPLEDVPEGLERLAELYNATAGMLENLRATVPPFDEPRCWPHHFDLASLAVLATDNAATMTHTLGIGVTPPDSVEPAGYWYVSPWAKDGTDAASQYARLSIGRWFDRGGAPPMAVLPVSEPSESDDLGVFVAEAVNASMEVFDG